MSTSSHHRHVLSHVCMPCTDTYIYAATHTHEEDVHCLSLVSISLKKSSRRKEKPKAPTKIEVVCVDILGPVNDPWIRIAVSIVWGFAFGDHMGFSDHSAGVEPTGRTIGYSVSSLPCL